MPKPAVVILLLALPLVGCADYLNRYDTVTLAAGDAQKYNAMLQTKDPFNPASDDTAISTDGQRTADVTARYRGSMRGGKGPASSGADKDCANGSGNNPVVDGPVPTTGADPHRLDRDNDGVGCE